ncbi:methionine ABC transporter ATP-binding protein [Xylanimonas allomyrinae]|uniref:methionine ABC transporter ATP-binding protein n=1 Tax=Xylanimonas allomyrinae TaxID=2509459 RepID=UPI001FE9CEAD|nr:methionine ABC transporter ATP-binding protein [Xylanimonas allomyrinae]
MPPLPTDTARVRIAGLRKVYGSGERAVTALAGIDLTVRAGEIHGVVGRSGAGKSTLIRCLTLLERPTAGTIEVDGVELTALGERQLRSARRRIGLVFQHVNLLDSRTIAGNVAYPLQIAGVGRRERAARALELLDLVGLADRADAHPAQLSGGQRQRVGIARALAVQPAVLLCDEPTSALDGATTRQILSLIRDLRDRLGISVLVITHEMSVVRQVCDTVTLLDGGLVAEHGPVAEAAGRPGTRLARALIPVPDLPVGGERALLDVGFSTERTPTAHVLRAVADLGAAVEVAAGTIETIAGRQVGRLQLDVRADRVAVVEERLREIGLVPTAAGEGER